MRALVFAFALALSGGSPLAPAAAWAIGGESEGIDRGTFNSIIKCEVDIRADLYNKAAPATTDASIDAALSAIEGDTAGAPTATARKLQGWATVLRDGKASLRGKKGDARTAALEALQEKMGPMVAEAKAATGAK
jgi:hypothetical protein